MTRYLSVVVWASLAAAVMAAPANDDKKSAAVDATRLVQQLGSSKHADREAAVKALDALGVAALPALREAVKSSDAEVRRRAGDLLAKLGKQAESTAAMAPTKVRLKAADVPLAEVARDLSKQANVRIQLAREPVDLAARRVTIDTGETSFWEALDALSRTAKVSLRPSTLDPTADDAAGGHGVVNGFGGGVPMNALLPNGAVMFTSVGGAQVGESLVLQDGLLPSYPTAVIGAARVRLIPDRWVNRERNPGDEMKWTLEVLTEPRMRWVGQPSFRFDSRPGVSFDATPQAAVGEVIPPVNRRVMMNGLGVANVVGSSLSGVTRYELPVYVKSAAGTPIPELKGTLSGTVLATVGAVATIADATQEKAGAETKDGTKVTIREYGRDDDGVVTLTVDLERGAGAGGRIGVAGNPGGNRFGRGVGGAIPPGVAQFVAGSDGMLQSVKLSDDTGRPYETTVTGSDLNQRNGAMAVTLKLECRPPATNSKPGAFEVHGPRSLGVQAAFTLRDVPAVQ